MEYVDDMQLKKIVKQSSEFKLKQGMRVKVLPEYLATNTSSRGGRYTEELRMASVNGHVYTVEVTYEAGEICYLDDSALGIVYKEWLQEA